MDLLAGLIDFEGNGVLLQTLEAQKYGLVQGDRIEIINPVSGRSIVDSVEFTTSVIPKGSIGLSIRAAELIQVTDGDRVEVKTIPLPVSLEYIKKKMDGQKLSREEIENIVTDIVNDKISSGELSAFIVACYINPLDMDEIEYLSKAMAETGKRLEFFSRPVVDKHSIGGVPGNKVTLLIVPIIAANGLLIPKTSSRAITGAGGTADLMEVLAPVEFSAAEITCMTQKTKGVIVWGGSSNVASADGKIIIQEYPFKIDPIDLMLASVMSKKAAAGVNVLAIDIPVGKSCKVKDIDEGEKLSQMFIELGRRLNIRVECALTYGDAPVGHAIGPKLEVKEALAVLEGSDEPHSLIQKSCVLAGMVLELAGKAGINEGYNLALKTIKSGAALKKMREIIEVQGGDSSVTSEDIVPGVFSHTIKSDIDGYVTYVKNRELIAIARTAGSPSDKGAGIYLHVKPGVMVNKGDPLMIIYSDQKWKLEKALSEALILYPVIIGGMLIERVNQYRRPV